MCKLPSSDAFTIQLLVQMKQAHILDAPVAHHRCVHLKIKALADNYEGIVNHWRVRIRHRPGRNRLSLNDTYWATEAWQNPGCQPLAAWVHAVQPTLEV